MGEKAQCLLEYGRSQQQAAGRAAASAERVAEVVAATMAVMDRMDNKSAPITDGDTLSFQPCMRAHEPAASAAAEACKGSSASVPEPSSGDASSATEGYDSDVTEVYAAEPHPPRATTPDILAAQERIYVTRPVRGKRKRDRGPALPSVRALDPKDTCAPAWATRTPLTTTSTHSNRGELERSSVLSPAGKGSARHAHLASRGKNRVEDRSTGKN